MATNIYLTKLLLVTSLLCAKNAIPVLIKQKNILTQTKNNITQTITCIGAYNKPQKLIIAYQNTLTGFYCALTITHSVITYNMQKTHLGDGEENQLGRATFRTLDYLFYQK